MFEEALHCCESDAYPFLKNAILHLQSGMGVMPLSATYPCAPGVFLLSSFKEKTLCSDHELALQL